LYGPEKYGHWFNFNVWKKSIKVRYFTEGLIVLLIAILTQYYCSKFVDSYKVLIPIFTEFAAIMTILFDPNSTDEAKAAA